MDEQKSTYWRFVGKFLLVILIAVGVLIGWGLYMKISGERAVDKLARSLEEAQKQDYERAMADTYGGKTPQETLRLYIEAVEAGNYELASKYFVIGKQEEGLSILKQTAQNKNIDFLLSKIRETATSEGYPSSAGDIYTIEKPVFVEFTKYPNGIWKIAEI